MLYYVCFVGRVTFDYAISFNGFIVSSNSNKSDGYYSYLVVYQVPH